MLYASLTGPLLGLYFPVPTDDEVIARKMLASSSLNKLWCSVYTIDEVVRQIRQHGGEILADSHASQLDYNHFKTFGG
jgi:hypothetical protein